MFAVAVVHARSHATFRGLALVLALAAHSACSLGCGRIGFGALGVVNVDGGIGMLDGARMDGAGTSHEGGPPSDGALSDTPTAADAGPRPDGAISDGGPAMMTDSGVSMDGGVGTPDSGPATISCPATLTCRVEVFGGHSYCACNGTRGWDQAEAACEASGLTLIRVDDAAEDAFATGLFIGRRTWIGATDVAEEGVFRWVLGGDVVFPAPVICSNWEPGEPDNLREADCAFIETSGGWDDDRCDPLTAYRFICEQP